MGYICAERGWINQKEFLIRAYQCSFIAIINTGQISSLHWKITCSYWVWVVAASECIRKKEKKHSRGYQDLLHSDTGTDTNPVF